MRILGNRIGMKNPVSENEGQGSPSTSGSSSYNLYYNSVIPYEYGRRR